MEELPQTGQPRESHVGEVSLDTVLAARSRIEGVVDHTPVEHSVTLSGRFGSDIYLKMENWQRCGCFKVRGACNAVFSLSREELSRTLVTTSSGNHGTALAYAASHMPGATTRIFVPDDAEQVKLEKMRHYGAQIVYGGKDYTAALREAERFIRDQGGTYVHSHDDPRVISGQGTIGWEIIEELPAVDTVIVPVGGGGLISGISTAVHGIKPEVRIIGVEAEAAPGAHTSLRDGGPRTVDISPSLADGLLGTLTDRTYRIVRRQVERVELVTESEIEDALYLLQQSDRIMAEGSAVVGLAALLAGRIELPAGSSCVLVLTGRNVSAGTYNAALRRAERRV